MELFVKIINLNCLTYNDIYLWYCEQLSTTLIPFHC